MLTKLLFLVLLVVVVVAVMQKRRNDRLRLEKKPEMSVKKMVQCPVCGVHFVEVDGVWVNGTMYCSHECAEKAKGSTE